MTHASLFTGIGACELAAERMGWQNLFGCEIDPFCNRVLEYHYPNEIHYGDIRTTDFSEWRGKVNVLTGGFPCFAAGTPVLTGRGFVPIEEVAAGDTVLSKDGRYHEVESLMRHVADRVVRMRAQGMWEPLEATPNHRFWIMRRKGRGFLDPEWVPIGDAKVGDRIGYPVHEGADASFTPEFWRLVGLWIADGWILDGKRKATPYDAAHGRTRPDSRNHKTVICCGKKNITRLHHTIQKAGYKYTLSEEKSTFKAIICDVWLCDFLKGFGRYAHGKRLSPQCFALDNVRKGALLEGMMADGCENDRGGYTITTVSQELALGIAQIARDVCRCPVSIMKKTVNRECVIEGRRVNERPQYQVTISHSTRYGGYRDGLVWCNIKSLETREESKEVFNLSVYGEHTYNIYGIAVHNCQPFSCAGGRKGTEDDRYLWPRMLEVIRQVRPDWIVGENVAGILTMVFPGKETEVGSGETLFGEGYTLRELRQRYVADSICSDLEHEGYSVIPVVIPACAVGAPHRRDRVWFVARNDWDSASHAHHEDGCGGAGKEKGASEGKGRVEPEPGGEREVRAVAHADYDGGQETSWRGRQEDGESDGQSQSRVDSGIGASAHTDLTGRIKERGDNGEGRVRDAGERQGDKEEQERGQCDYGGDCEDGNAEPASLAGGLGRGGGRGDRGGGLFPDDGQRDAPQGEQAGDGRLDRAGTDGRAGTAPDTPCVGRGQGRAAGHGQDQDAPVGTDLLLQPQRHACERASAHAEGGGGGLSGSAYGRSRTDAEEGRTDLLPEPPGPREEQPAPDTAERVPALPQEWWRDFPTQSPVCSGDDGLSSRLLGITFPKWRQEAIKALGNSMCVAVVYELFRAIQTVEDILGGRDDEENDKTE